MALSKRMALSKSRGRGAISLKRIAAGIGAVGLIAASTASSAAGAQATGTPYTVGVISSDSGQGSTTGDGSTTVHAWVKYTNAHGGINGHPVKLMYFNDATNPANGVSDAQSIINSNAVAILDSSFVDSAFEKAADAAKIPVISLTGSGATLTYATDPNFFGDSTSNLAAAYSQIYAAKYSGAKSMGYMYCAEFSACSALIPIAKTYAKAVGIPITYTASISASAPNYAAECLAAKASGTQALFMVVPGASELERVAANCATQGYDPTKVAGSGNIPNSALTLPGFSHVIGTIGTFPAFLDTTPAMKVFHQVMNSTLAKSTQPSIVSATWTGMQLFAAAAANAGNNPTRAAIYKGLYAISGTDLGGLAPKLVFTPGKPTQASCFFLIESTKGSKYTSPNGGKPVCVTLPPLG